jgi:predicted regulator of Ras-like GTPase activity (Roadblock/LC7/MglB family)
VFQQRLDDLRRAIPGTRLVCLAAGDGITIESVGDDGLDVEIQAAEFVSMARGIASEQRALSVGETQRLEIATDRYGVILTRVRNGYYLLLAVDAAQPLGRARFEMRRAALGLEADLV